MSYQSEREDFIVRMASYGVDAHTARLILRHATTHKRLCERECNGTDWECGALQRCPARKSVTLGWCCECGAQDAALGHGRVTRSSVRISQIEARITVLCKSESGAVVPEFQGDPRGATVKLQCLGVVTVYVPARSR